MCYHLTLSVILYVRRLFPANWRMKPFGKRPDSRELVFDGVSSRRHVGRPLAFCSGTNAALYASTGAASISLVGVPARGTDANRHGSPMAGRVLLDWDTVDDSKWHSVLCILSPPRPLSLFYVLRNRSLLLSLLLSPIILSQSCDTLFKELYSSFFSTKQFVSLRLFV